ncbi:MAG: cupin domain-containing protein [Salinarchaeum sp.]
MESMQVDDLVEQLNEADEPSMEALRTAAMSVDVYSFEPGAEDPMHSHGEDEVYYVVSGSGSLNIEGDYQSVEEGDLIYVEPGTEHQFTDFEDELVMVVFYAPPHGSQS